MSWIRRAAWSFPFFAIFIIVPAAAVHAQSVDIVGLDRQSVKLHKQGKDKEATELAEEAVALAQRTYGTDHPQTLKSLDNLASLYEAQGLYGEAEPLFKRALAGFERTFGNEAPETLSAVSSLASLYEEQDLYAQAEPLFKRALDGLERTRGADDLQTLISANSLASLYRAQGRYAEAEPLYKRVSAGFERVFGPEHPDTLASVSNLAQLYIAQGHYGDAEPLYKRALEARERVLGPDHPQTLRSVADLAALDFNQRNWASAAELWRRSTAAISARTLRGAQDTGQALTDKPGEAEQAGSQFRALVKAAYRLTPQGGMPDADLAREMFETAQRAQNFEARELLTRMAVRAAASNPALETLVHERQVLAEEWLNRDRVKNAALSQAAEKRETGAEAENLDRLAAIDARLKEIDAELAAKFPRYADLVSPAPVTVEEIQALLGDDEALVLFLDTRELGPAPEETFIWVVTKTASRWVRSPMGTPTLAQEVAALRCGLDKAAWEGPRCEQLTGQHYTDADRNAGKPPPFDHARAHRLYQALFSQVEDLIKGKHLLIVPSGPLTQLPIQVLVTTTPLANGDDKSLAWLIRTHAISVLPSASSLRAIRRLAQPGVAEKPMIGFGNPLLNGPDGAYAQLAKLARDGKTCAANTEAPTASAPLPRGVPTIQIIGGLADVSFLRMLPPLPETAGELCAIARDVHAEARDIYLGARAMEHVVKRLSETGELAKYRIAHFATHCALASDAAGNAEPGLILTPPDTPSETDDGYLTASEIAALNLDADWVILSACNTAAGGALDAGALSGLARGFLYAQARALLVSRWEVNPEATVKLITGAINRLAADRSMGRAEAMRQSMLDLIDNGNGEETHPAIWAPFVVVGEGGAGR